MVKTAQNNSEEQAHPERRFSRITRVLQQPRFYFCPLRMEVKPQVTWRSPAPHPTVTTRGTMPTRALSLNQRKESRLGHFCMTHPAGPEPPPVLWGQ